MSEFLEHYTVCISYCFTSHIPIKTARIVKLVIILHYLMQPVILVNLQWRRQGR